MNHERLIAALTRPDVLDEMHHFLWLDPHDNRGSWDEGWNCRDHALVTATLAQLLGFTAVLGFGKASFVQGPHGDAPSMGLELNTHAWTMVERSGMYDLSPRLARIIAPGWRASSVVAVAASSCQPAAKARFSFVLEAEQYENKVALASHDQDFLNVVFWGQESQDLSRRALGDSLNCCNSPLTDRLRTQFGERGDLHAKAALHFWELIKGEANSLMHLPQMDAWKSVADRKGDAVYRVCSRGKIT